MEFIVTVRRLMWFWPGGRREVNNTKTAAEEEEKLSSTGSERRMKGVAAIARLSQRRLPPFSEPRRISGTSISLRIGASLTDSGATRKSFACPLRCALEFLG